MSIQAISQYIKGLNDKKDTSVKGRDPKPKKIKQVYTIQDVIKQHYRDLIEAQISFKPTNKEYIGSYLINFHNKVNTSVETLVKVNTAYSPTN
jgi:hypothetical protein